MYRKSLVNGSAGFNFRAVGRGRTEDTEAVIAQGLFSPAASSGLGVLRGAHPRSLRSPAYAAAPSGRRGSRTPVSSLLRTLACAPPAPPPAHSTLFLPGSGAPLRSLRASVPIKRPAGPRTLLLLSTKPGCDVFSPPAANATKRKPCGRRTHLRAERRLLTVWS